MTEETTNGHAPKKRGGWRDITAARLARLDPAGVEARKVLAEKMLRAGEKHTEIIKATKEKTGTAIGGGTLMSLRKRLKREETNRKRQRTRKANRKTPHAEGGPGEPPWVVPAEPNTDVVGSADWIQVGSNPATAAKLMKAGLVFSFDGETLSMKIG